MREDLELAANLIRFQTEAVGKASVARGNRLLAHVVCQMGNAALLAIEAVVDADARGDTERERLGEIVLAGVGCAEDPRGASGADLEVGAQPWHVHERLLECFSE